MSTLSTVLRYPDPPHTYINRPAQRARASSAPSAPRIAVIVASRRRASRTAWWARIWPRRVATNPYLMRCQLHNAEDSSARRNSTGISARCVSAKKMWQASRKVSVKSFRLAGYLWLLKWLSSPAAACSCSWCTLQVETSASVYSIKYNDNISKLKSV